MHLHIRTVPGKDHDMSKSNNIIILPELEELKAEVERLRTELSMLMLERDELKFVICKNIEAEYMLKLGGLEYKAYEAQCNVLRLKRQLELMQARLNRQESIVMAVIETILNTEFAEYQKKLDEQVGKMNEAIERSNADVLSEEETKELKKLYRKIVKALHPDMNPNITDAQRQLFDNAVMAYKNGNLDALRAIAGMIGDADLQVNQTDAKARLLEEKKSLEKLLENAREEIQTIKSEYPYTMKELLADDEKVEARKRELELIISKYEEIAGVYKARIDELMKKVV